MRAVLRRGWPDRAVAGPRLRLLLIGYFEGLDAERAIAWRASDSFVLREFLGVGAARRAAGSFDDLRTRRLIDLETHQAVFTWMLQRLADAGLVKGKTVGIDARSQRGTAQHRAARHGRELPRLFWATSDRAMMR